MSGFDPIAALGADAVAAAQAAMDEAALNIGVSTEILQAQISVGDVLSATVLPPQNGVDHISLMGQTIAAQLPAGVYPGETLALQVTSFGANTVVVRNLGVIDAENPPPIVDVQLPPPVDDGAPQTAILRTVPPLQQQPTTATQPNGVQTNSASPPSIGIAPPREIFVAASVRPGQTPVSPVSPRVEPQALDVEARIAMARAAGTMPGSTPSAARPLIAVPQTSAPSNGAAQTPVVALLARLRIPATPITLAAAKIVDNAAQVLPKAYAQLDVILARMSSTDPRVASLRSLLSFTSDINPGDERALPEQIASFVSNVLDSAEGKIATIVSAILNASDAETTSQAEPAPEAPVAAQPSPAAPNGTTSATSMPAAASQAETIAVHTLPVAAQAQVAERAVALENDVKTLLLSLAQQPPNNAPPALAQAVNNAVVATTAVQMNALGAQNVDPNTIMIPLPVAFYEGGRPASIRVSRDAPNARQRFDADNFHIAFVLDTQSLGTVAIDLQSVGRAVRINVKTERASIADRMRTTLGDLRARLESLRYRVAAIGADVAATTAAREARPPAQPRSSSKVDLRA